MVGKVFDRFCGVLVNEWLLEKDSESRSSGSVVKVSWDVKGGSDLCDTIVEEIQNNGFEIGGFGN